MWTNLEALHRTKNISFNFKDAMCQNVCTMHGLQEGWVFCVLHAV